MGKYRAVLNVKQSVTYDTIEVWTIQKKCLWFWRYFSTITFSKGKHEAVAKYLASLRNPLIIEEQP